jgi:hypothetical protein
MLTKIKPGYSDILHNPTHFPGPLVCLNRQFPLYMCARGTDSHSAIFLFLFYLMTIPTVWYNIYIDGKNANVIFSLKNKIRVPPIQVK